MSAAGSRQELRDWLAVARRAALAGGAVLERWRQSGGLRTEFKGRRELVTEADRESERAVVEVLMAACPGHAVLAEEGALTEAGRASTGSEFLWILDPLDGTTNFVHGLPFFAVAVALAVAGEVVLGVVHAPALAATFEAASGLGALRNGEPIRVSATARLADALLATGFSYNRNEPGTDDNVGRIAAVLPACRDLRRFGSAQLDLCLTAAGAFDGYWELYLQPYDVAAGAVLVQQAGGLVTDLRGGGDWLYGGRILASNRHLHRQLLQFVGDGAAAGE